MDLPERYRTLHDRIEAAAAKDGRAGSDVRLVAVTKFATDDQIRELLDLGHRDLGENRLQVMEAHAETVADWQERHALIGAGEETVRWHFIGGLQRNKIKSVCRSCRLIHSVDNLRLAEEIDKASANLGRSEPMEVLIQVNVAGEKQKGGRGYDFLEVIKWWAQHSDRVLILFDPNKLDISDEFRSVIEEVRANPRHPCPVFPHH